MAASGFTPISLYYSTTALAVPVNTNLAFGELAINITDGKLYYKDNLGVVKFIGSSAGGTNTQVQYNSSGILAGSANLTFTGSTLTLTGNQVISVTDNTNAALRITQTGTGNALLVEDSANPDSTPFVIDASGNVGIGNTTPTAKLEVTGTAKLPGTSSSVAALLTDAAEVTTISATAATGTIAYYPSTQSVLYYTSNATSNWTVNLTFSAGTTLNTALSTGQSLTVAFLVTQGATAYYNSIVEVDGTASGVTTKWQGGAPTTGYANGINVYTYTVIKTGSATFTVLASLVQFS